MPLRVTGNCSYYSNGNIIQADCASSGLPFSDFFGKVEPKRKIPVNALCLTVFVQLALDSIYFGTVTGFETVISIATEGFCASPPPSPVPPIPTH